MYDDQYEKAECFLPAKIKSQIKNMQVIPHWTVGGDSFWYKKELDGGVSFVLLDCESGVEDMLFDHKILAKLLSDHFDRAILPNSIPLTDVAIQNSNELIIKIFGQSLCFNRDRCTLCLLNEKLENCTVKCANVMNLFDPCVDMYADCLFSPSKEYLLIKKDHDLQLMHLGSKTETVLTHNGEADYSYASSPDSNLSIVSRKRAGIKMPPVAIWAPNSKLFVTHQLDQRGVEDLFLVQNISDDGSFRPVLHRYKMPFPGEKHIPVTKLLVFDAESGEQVEIDAPPLNAAMFGSAIEMGYVWWSKDSSSLYFIRENRGYTELQLCVADVKTGQVRTLITERAEDYVEPSQLLFWQQYTCVVDDESQNIVWLSNNQEWAHLYLYSSVDGRLLKQLTSGEFNVRKILRVDASSGWVYFIASGRENGVDPYYRYLYRVKIDGSLIELLTPEPVDHTITFSSSGRYFVDNCSTLDSIPVAKLRKCDGSLLKTIVEADFTELKKKKWVAPEPFCLKADDGLTDVYGVIYRPTNFDPKKSYPIIDYAYPAPQMLAAAKTYHFDPPAALFSPWLPQSYAELGFIVVAIDGSGTPLRSKNFHHASYGDLQNASGLKDHIAVIKQLNVRYDYIDIERVGIIGSSQGGYAAARAIMEFPDFYKVAVAISGNYDLRCYLALWGEKYQGLDIADSYEDYAFTDIVDNLQGKLFLIHGELDDNVHPCSALRLVDQLIKADKDFDFLLIPNANHGCLIGSPYTVRRTWKYFLDYLKV